MKMPVKRIFQLAGASVMVVGLLSGCGGDDNPNKANPSAKYDSNGQKSDPIAEVQSVPEDWEYINSEFEIPSDLTALQNSTATCTYTIREINKIEEKPRVLDVVEDSEVLYSIRSDKKNLYVPGITTGSDIQGSKRTESTYVFKNRPKNSNGDGIRIIYSCKTAKDWSADEMNLLMSSTIIHVNGLGDGNE